MSNPQNHESAGYEKLSFLALLGLSLSVFLGKSYLNTLQAMDSSVYGRLALDATRNGIIPTLPIGNLQLQQGHWPVGFNDHPFTLIWLNGWVMRLIGPETWSARLLPALFSVLCIALVYQIGKKLYRSHVVGLASGFIALATPLFMSYGSRFHLDSGLILGILLSYYGWITRSHPLTLLGTLIAVWIKGPLGFLLYPMIFISHFVTKSWNLKEIKRFAGISLAALLAGGSIWAIIAWIGSSELVLDYWQRFVLGQVANRGVVPTLPILTKISLKWFPWVILFGVALYRYLKQARYRDETLTLPLVSGSFILLLISIMKFKYEHYYLPMFPFFALFIAGSFKETIQAKAKGIQTGVLVLGLLVPPVLLANPIDVGVEKFPQLKVMIPYIQSYGSCRDQVVFLEGSQPYGGIGDYAAVLQFYTNRHTVEARCENLDETLARTQAAWLLASEELLRKCAGDASRKFWRSGLRYGSQTLWSRYEIPNGELTPLSLPYRAIADCELPKMPRSRYFR